LKTAVQSDKILLFRPHYLGQLVSRFPMCRIHGDTPRNWLDFRLSNEQKI